MAKMQQLRGQQVVSKGDLIVAHPQKIFRKPLSLLVGDDRLELSTR
jgi:hypothetical protein